jgi:4-aminobutyrate aminotransferase-like enzyme
LRPPIFRSLDGAGELSEEELFHDHGRTMMGMALTGKVAPYKVGFGPFPAEVYHAKFPCALHGVSVADAMASIEAL